ncbi:hypothetical protein HY995_00825 [Candidatus Micrarchaeota archaeon]|nr:hypothetical protein [Candidatus Micrarchaeota archaeon]
MARHAPNFIRIIQTLLSLALAVLSALSAYDSSKLKAFLPVQGAVALLAFTILSITFFALAIGIITGKRWSYRLAGYACLANVAAIIGMASVKIPTALAGGVSNRGTLLLAVAMSGLAIVLAIAVRLSQTDPGKFWRISLPPKPGKERK